MKKYFVIFFSLFLLLITSCSGLNLSDQKNGEVSFDVAEIAKACSPVFSNGLSSRAATTSEEMENYINSLIKYDLSFDLLEDGKVAASKSTQLSLLQFINADNQKSYIDSNVAFDKVAIGKKVKVSVSIKLNEGSFENIEQQIRAKFKEVFGEAASENDIQKEVLKFKNAKKLYNSFEISGTSDEIAIIPGKNLVVVKLSKKDKTRIIIDQGEHLDDLYFYIKSEDAGPGTPKKITLTLDNSSETKKYDSYVWEYSLVYGPYTKIEKGQQVSVEHNGTQAKFELDGDGKKLEIKMDPASYSNRKKIMVRCTAHVVGSAAEYDDEVLELGNLPN